MPNPEDVVHVDSDGNFIGWIDRETVHRNNLVHRSINILVFHPQDGRLLVQRRHRDKLTHPNHWDVSVAGHVDYSDHPNGDPHADMAAFLASATRELHEEVGVSEPLILIGVYGPEPGGSYGYNALYRCESTGPFVIQQTEVQEVRWVNHHELLNLSPRTQQLDWVAQNILGWF